MGIYILGTANAVKEKKEREKKRKKGKRKREREREKTGIEEIDSIFID